MCLVHSNLTEISFVQILPKEIFCDTRDWQLHFDFLSKNKGAHTMWRRGAVRHKDRTLKQNRPGECTRVKLKV